MFRKVLPVIISTLLYSQSRPVPYNLVWEGGDLVVLDAKGPFREYIKGGITKRVDFPSFEEGSQFVDFQDNYLWANSYLDVKDGLAVVVSKYAADGTRIKVGVLNVPYIRGTKVMPLKNGKFIGFVMNFEFEKANSNITGYGPVVYLSVTEKEELVITGWGDLALSKPYYNKLRKPISQSHYNYLSLSTDISADPTPIRVGDYIVLPSFYTGFIFVFSAIDGKLMRTIDFFDIGEESLKNSFDGAALISLIPTKNDNLLVLHRPSINLGSRQPLIDDNQSMEAISDQLAKLHAAAEDNASLYSKTEWTIIDPSTGERYNYDEPQNLPKPFIDILLGKYKIRFNAAGLLQKVD